MNTNKLQKRLFKDIAKHIISVCNIVDRNDYDISFVKPFILDLNRFVEELKELVDNV